MTEFFKVYLFFFISEVGGDFSSPEAVFSFAHALDKVTDRRIQGLNQLSWDLFLSHLTTSSFTLMPQLLCDLKDSRLSICADYYIWDDATLYHEIMQATSRSHPKS
jgi:hypothetical protein